MLALMSSCQRGLRQLRTEPEMSTPVFELVSSYAFFVALRNAVTHSAGDAKTKRAYWQ